MKKKLLTGILAFCFQAAAAQENVFSQSEQSYKAQQHEAEQIQAKSDPTDPNPAPIDDYIPLLAIAGAALAIYAARKKQLQTGR